MKLKIPTHTSLSEIYSCGLEYSFLSDDDTPVHSFVYCKDFLQDIIWAWINQKPASIYGLSYNPKNGIGPCINRLKIVLRLKNAELLQKTKRAIRLLGHLKQNYILCQHLEYVV